MADIFISYGREDRPKAQRLAEIFEAGGLSVWWDTGIKAGEVWDEVIEQELTAARCVVVLWSTVSVQKQWVRSEANEGLRRQILVPVLIESVNPPLGFQLIQWQDLSDWHGESSHPGLNGLMSAVGEKIKCEVEKTNSRRPSTKRSNLGTIQKSPAWQSSRYFFGISVLLALVMSGVVIFTFLQSQHKAVPTSATESGTSRLPNQSSTAPVTPSPATGRPVTSGVPGQYPFLSERLITRADIEQLSCPELRIARNEIFARHGYIFQTADMRQYFTAQPWYVPASHDAAAQLTALEQQNVQVIQRYERENRC